MQFINKYGKIALGDKMSENLFRKQEKKIHKIYIQENNRNTRDSNKYNFLLAILYIDCMLSLYLYDENVTLCIG